MCKVKDLRDFDSFFELVQYFTTEEKCVDYLAVMRWNGEPACPYCGSVKVSMLKGKTKRYKCYDCRSQFGVRVGTIFHDSKLSLQKWFFAIYLVTSHKKGISSHQLARDLKITQKSAWHLAHRIRETFQPEAMNFSNTVELDETYVGGKEKNKHQNKRTEGTQGRSTKTKTPVLGIMERSGKVYAVPVTDTRKRTIVPIITSKVAEGTKVYTDELAVYKSLSGLFEHKFVKHKANEYVNGEVHTNNIEGFWALLKRGIMGTYHHMSDKHLGKYVNEFTFRYNNRTMTEGSRFDVMLANCNNKRLTYAELTKKVNEV